MTDLVKITETSLIEVREQFSQLKAEKGRKVLGGVAGRELSEDSYRGVDEFCQRIILGTMPPEVIRNTLVVSEHGVEGSQDATLRLYIDPFDGTEQYALGWLQDWWSVLSFAGPDGAFVGGAIDMLFPRMYVAGDGTVTSIFIQNKIRTQVIPSRQTALGPTTRLAAYLGKAKYSIPWFERMGPVLGTPELAGITLREGGGSFIYALLAAGDVDAYVMFGEPVSEIWPGLAFVQAANLSLLSVNPDGTIVALNPQSWEYQEGARVPFFIASCTEELGRDIAAQVLTV